MLHECLDSILALNMKVDEREIIVIDDGSDFSPVDYVRSINDGIIFLRQENQGPGAARNNGIDIATGDYIQFVDSDDYLLPNYSRCLDIMEKEKPDIVMFHGRKTPFYRIESTGTDYMLSHNLRGAAWCIAFRKTILGELRYNTLLINEDELFNPQLVLQAERLIDVGIHAYYYRQRKESRSHSNNINKATRRLDDALKVICRLNEISDDMGGNKKVALQRRIAQLTMDYIYNVAVTFPQELLQRVRQLQRKLLFPLPLKFYTAKYYIFALITRIL